MHRFLNTLIRRVSGVRKSRVLRKGRRTRPGRGSSARPQLEPLEGRVLPSTISLISKNLTLQLDDQAVMDPVKLGGADVVGLNAVMVTSVTDASAQEYLDRVHPQVNAPFAQLLVGKLNPDGSRTPTWYRATAMKFNNNVLDLTGFQSADNSPCANDYDVQLEVGQGPLNDYLSFTVKDIWVNGQSAKDGNLPDKLLPDELRFLNFTTALNNPSFTSDVSGVASDGTFAIFNRSATPAAYAGVNGNSPEYAGLTPSIYLDFSTLTTISDAPSPSGSRSHMVDGKFYLGGSSYGSNGSTILSALNTLVANEGLPTSAFGGPSAFGAPINQLSYVFAYDLTSDNVQQWIRLAKQMNAGIIHLGFGDWNLNYHYDINTNNFPHGLGNAGDPRSLAGVVSQIHAAGLEVGFHCLTAAIGGQDSYVSPTPDARLGKNYEFILDTDAGGKITVTAPLGLPLPDSLTGGNVLQIDNELIRYSTYTRNGNTATFDGTMSYFGTTRVSHAAGAKVWHLYILADPSGDLFSADPDSTLMDEIATSVSKTLNAVAADMVYLDGADVGVGGLYGSYGMGKAQEAIFKQIDHPMRVQTSASVPYVWSFVSVDGQTDFREGKGYVDDLTLAIPLVRTSRLHPADMGWWRLNTRPEQMEYFLAKNAALGVPASYQGVSLAPQNGWHKSYLQMIREYAAIAPLVAQQPTLQAAMQAPGNDFHLSPDSAGNLVLTPVAYPYHQVTLLDNTWTVTNSTSQLAVPTIQLEGLTGILVDPSVTIGGSTVTFPVTLQSGQFIQFNSVTDCKLYNANGFLIQSITPTGMLGLLNPGSTTISFGYQSWTANGAANPRAAVTIGIPNAAGATTFTDVPPVILTEPVDQAADPAIGTAQATTATFFVQATGPGLSYQWQKWDGNNWIDVDGATDPAYATPPVTAADDGTQFRVVVSNDNGSVTSSVATLHVNSGIVGWWKFDETSGTSAADASGSANTGTLVNGPTWAGGILNGSLALANPNPTGQGQYVRVEDNQDLQYTGGGFTLSMWVYINPMQPNTVVHVLSKRWYSQDQYNYYLRLISDNIGGITVGFGLQFTFPGAIEITSSLVQANQWHHLAATVDGGTKVMSLYVDGALVKSSEYNITTWDPAPPGPGIFPGPLFIGTTDPPSSGGSFDGKIDNLRIYTTALSPVAIAAQARAPVGYWKFDEGSGTTAADSSGNGYTGTLLNGAQFSDTGEFNESLALANSSPNPGNQYVSVQDVPALKYTGGGLTLSMWVYINPTETTGGYLLSKPWNSQGESNYGLRLMTDNTVRFGLQAGGTGGIEIASPGALAAGQWHHLAATVDGGTKLMSLYVDGALVASGYHAITNWTPTSGDLNLPLCIGTLYPYDTGWAGNPSFSFDGQIDEVHVYNQALTATDIQTLAIDPPTGENDPAKPVVNGAGADKVLIALWRYLEHGEVPEGAQEKDWRLRVDSTARRHARLAAAAAQ